MSFKIRFTFNLKHIKYFFCPPIFHHLSETESKHNYPDPMVGEWLLFNHGVCVSANKGAYILANQVEDESSQCIQ